jgi:regulatory protein
VTDQYGDGAGDATIIPFPAHRVSAPQEPEVTPASVEDLRERIAHIESGDIASVAESGRSITDVFSVPTREEKRAKNVALHQLGVSGRSEAEVRQRLSSKDITPEVIDQEVGRLVEVGLIDDLALATTLVESLRGRKKLGDMAIVQVLRRRHIPADIIDQALATGTIDSDVAVFELARDRARSLRHLDADVAFRRLVGFVQRRGYTGPQVFEAARRALDEASEVS